MSLPTRSTRLHQLFRTSHRLGTAHPLLRVMQTYRAEGPPDAPVEPAPAAVAGAVPRSILPEQVQRRVADLPPLPQAAVRALRTLRREDTSLEDVAADLSCDASLTARVLRLANSPFYGVPGRVSTARDAAQVLGRRTLESVLTLAAVAGQFGKHRSKSFDAAAFWRHALGSAIAARGLARVAGCSEDEAFVAGLLHDIGLLAMSVYFPEELDELIDSARGADVELCTIERQHGLTGHALIGSWIALHWHFPSAVAQAISTHHAVTTDADPPAGISDCVHVANAITHALDVAQLERELVPTIEPGAWRRLGLDDEALSRVLDETESGVRALCSALSL